MVLIAEQLLNHKFLAPVNENKLGNVLEIRVISHYFLNRSFSKFILDINVRRSEDSGMFVNQEFFEIYKD
jgi:hypothetical protein